jgi:hypothetical protein
MPYRTSQLLLGRIIMVCQNGNTSSASFDRISSTVARWTSEDIGPSGQVNSLTADPEIGNRVRPNEQMTL